MIGLMDGQMDGDFFSETWCVFLHVFLRIRTFAYIANYQNQKFQHDSILPNPQAIFRICQLS